MIPPVSQSYNSVVALPHAAAVEALTEYFLLLRSQHYQLYFLTLTYKEATDNPLTLASISDAFTGIYVELLRRYVHRLNFARHKYRPLQPIVFAFPDRSQSKFKLAPNTSQGIVGFHHHAIVAARPEVAARFDPLCLTDSLTCLSSFILTSDLQRIGTTQDDVHKVVDYSASYAFKKLPKADEDHRLLVCPAVEQWKQSPATKKKGVGQIAEIRDIRPAHKCSAFFRKCRPTKHANPLDRAKLLASCLGVRYTRSIGN